MPTIPHLPFHLSTRHIAWSDSCQWQFLQFLEHLIAGGKSGDFDPHTPPLFRRIGQLTRTWETHILSRYYRNEAYTTIDMEGQETLLLDDVVQDHERVVLHSPKIFSDKGLWGTIPFLIRESDHWLIQTPKHGSHIRNHVIANLGFHTLLAQIYGAGSDGLPLRTQVLLSSGKVHEVEPESALDYAEQILHDLQRLIDKRFDQQRPFRWDEIQDLCGTCWFCQQGVTDHNDVMQVLGIGTVARTQLYKAGVHTLDDLVETPSAHLPSLIEPSIIAQAKAQYHQQQQRKEPGMDNYVFAEVKTHTTLNDEDLPRLGPGDLFIDMEANSLHDNNKDGNNGLVYLIGVVGADLPSRQPNRKLTAPALTLKATPVWKTQQKTALTHVGDFSQQLGMTYWQLWSHNEKDEQASFRQFVQFMNERLKKYPDMHIYHYSHQERAVLKRKAHKYGLDTTQILQPKQRPGVFVDLFAIASRALRVGQPGMTLKELEPLFCGQVPRPDEVHDGADALLLYEELVDEMSLERLDANNDGTFAAGLANQLALYNEYDCCSMVLLHEWLREYAMH